MKCYVITIMSCEDSVKSADACIESAASFGITVEKFPAVSPVDNPKKMFKNKGIPIKEFENSKFSKFEPCLSCFLSHFLLWEKSVADNETILILEHDAVFTDNVKLNDLKFDKLLSLGHPSFGRFTEKKKKGIHKLYSKAFLPGAHAYIVKPAAASELIRVAKIRAKPTDCFISRNNFPWIEEIWPWPIKVVECMSTVQNAAGCKAKHDYKKNSKGYRFIDI